MNIIFDNVKIYNVQTGLDVVLGQEFVMETLEDFPPEMEVLATKDPVLSISEDGRTVTTTAIGKSNIKFMVGDSVMKNLYINVVDATHPNATTLGGALGPPVKK